MDGGRLDAGPNTLAGTVSRRGALRLLAGAAAGAAALLGRRPAPAAAQTPAARTGRRIVEFFEVYSEPRVARTTVMRSMRNVYQGSAWRFFDDGSFVVTGGPDNSFYPELYGTWARQADNSVAVHAARRYSVGYNGYTYFEMAARIRRGRARVAHLTEAVTASTVGGPRGESKLRYAEFALRLGPA